MQYNLNCPACKNWCDWQGPIDNGNWHCRSCGWSSESGLEHPVIQTPSVLQSDLDIEVKATKVVNIEPTYLGGAMSLGVKVKLEKVSVEDIIEDLVNMFGTDALIKAILGE